MADLLNRISVTVDAWPEASVYPPERLSDRERAILPLAWKAVYSDGYEGHVLSWPSVTPVPRARMVVLHGVQSHAGWYHGLGRRLAAAGIEAHFPDRRGSGANTVARGHAPSSRRLVDDIAQLLGAIRNQRHDSPDTSVPTVLAGISWGGKLVLVLAARHPGLMNAVALLCPGLKPRVNVTRRERLRVIAGLLSLRIDRAYIPIPLSDPALFTANLRAQQFIARDPLGLRLGSPGLLATSFLLDRALARSTRLVQQPALLMLGEDDRIVDNSQTRAVFESLGSDVKRIIAYAGAHHTLEFEPDPARYVKDLVGWMASTLNLPPGERK